MNKFIGYLGGFALVVLVVSMWRTPGGAAETVGDVVGWTADFVQEAIGKFSDFVAQF